VKTALEGLRVLDLSRVLAGPWAGQVLADFGADVVKVERPGRGDDTRSWGPPYIGDEADGMSAYFCTANRGKDSLGIDLRHPRGRELLRRLADTSDVLIENFRVGTMARYGLDYGTLSRTNPRLVYCSITAFGQDGPERDAPGYDAIIQGLGGLMSITGAPETEDGGGPQKVGVAVADLFCGMYAVSAILAALQARARDGIGQFIDLALMDCQVAMLANQAMNYLVDGRIPNRLGNAHPNIVPYQSFATMDGYLMVAVGNDAQFRRLTETLGLAGLADDPRFVSNRSRVEHRESLIPILEKVFASAPTRRWVARLKAAEVPSGPVNGIDAVFEEPQVRHRGLRLDLTDAAGRRIPGVANPIRFSATPVGYRAAPPRLGEMGHRVLRDWLNMSSTDISTLSEEGAIEISGPGKSGK
jgi:crotonobetainyl-CoA:carnitine CoA-transferase CaiB-like acyl-CoA transferase